MRTHSRMIEGQDPKHPGGGTLWSAYWHTLLTDLTYDDNFLSLRRTCPEDKDDFNIFYSLNSNAKIRKLSTENQLPMLGRGRKMSLAMFHANVGRRLFVTNKGYIGMCNEGIIAGDIVWILFGGKEPFIPCPTADCSGELQDVEECDSKREQFSFF
jgi:hypothetical protein